MTISEGYTTGLYTGYMLSFLTIFVYKFIYSSWMHQKFFISCGDHKVNVNSYRKKKYTPKRDKSRPKVLNNDKTPLKNNDIPESRIHRCSDGILSKDAKDNQETKIVDNIKSVNNVGNVCSICKNNNFLEESQIPPQREGYSKYVKMTDLGTTKCMIRDDCFEDKKKYKIDRKT